MRRILFGSRDSTGLRPSVPKSSLIPQWNLCLSISSSNRMENSLEFDRLEPQFKRNLKDGKKSLWVFSRKTSKQPIFGRWFLTTVIAATVACGATKKATEPVQPPGLIETVKNPASQRFVYTSSLSANSGFTIIATPTRIRLMLDSGSGNEWESTSDNQFVRGMVVRAKEVGDKVFLLTSEGYLYFFKPGKTRLKRVEVFSKPTGELELFPYTGTDGKYEITLVNGNCVVFLRCPDGKAECELRRTEGRRTLDETHPTERY